MPGSALRPDFPYSYRLLTVLAGTYVKKEVQISGEKIVYASPTSGTEIGIRLESSDQDAIPLRPNGEIVAPYSKFFIDGTLLVNITLLVAAPAGIQLTGRDVAISGNVNSVVTQSDLSYLVNSNNLYGGGGEVPTIASQFGNICLKNTDSVIRVELLEAYVWTNIAANVSWGINLGIGPAVFSFTVRRKWGTTTPAPIALPRGDTQAAAGGYIGLAEGFAANVPTQANVLLPVQITNCIIEPLAYFVVQCNTASARVGAFFTWRNI